MIFGIDSLLFHGTSIQNVERILRSDTLQATCRLPEQALHLLPGPTSGPADQAIRVSSLSRSIAVARTEPATPIKPPAAKAAPATEKPVAKEPEIVAAPKVEQVVEDKTEAIEVQPAAAKVDPTTNSFKANWQNILDVLSKKSRSAWAVAFTIWIGTV